MDPQPLPAIDPVAARRIDLELGMADDAIALLLQGGATRAIVGGLRFGEALLPEVRRHALGTGVTVEVLPAIDDAPADLLFQRQAQR
jgi:hypothetical protein